MPTERFSQHIAEEFARLEQRLNGASAGPMHALRTSGLQAFTQQGIPTPRNEEWKYTNVAPLLGLEYRSGSGVDDQTVNIAAVPGVEDIRSALSADTVYLCMLNGQLYAPGCSDRAGLSGVVIEPLTDALIAANEEIRKGLSSAAPADVHPFVALNTALTENGIVISVDRNTAVGQTIHIAMIGDARTANILHTPRVLIMAAEGSAVTVIESHHTLGGNTAMDVGVTEIVAHRNSVVRHVKVSDDRGDGRHIGYTGAKVYGDANVYSHVFCLGGPFTRNDLVIDLLEPNANGYLDGVSVLSEAEYADNHTVVDHTVPHCHSEELYKGVYDGRSTGVFNGKIFVRPQAQKTTAYQSNHTLLLSDRATINAKPQLEIWADDVKCSHGATTGQLNEDAVFYLQARGIGKDEARALMTYAFAAEVVERLPLVGLKSYIEQRIARKLGAEPYAE